MPFYTYRCERCDITREDLKCMAARDKLPRCTTCKKPMPREIEPVAGVVKNPAVPKRSR